MLNGPQAQFLGRGDLHETRFDHLGIQSEGYGLRLSQYTGPKVNEDWCKTTFRMYPSTKLEKAYTTNNGLLFAIGAVTIFIFTSLIFILYDRSVEKRQKIVLTTAMKTSAVVSNLFPEAVRDRLYENNTSSPGLHKRDVWNQKQQLVMTGVESRPYAGKPNCDLYPNTAIFFADIAGKSNKFAP